VWPSRFQSLVIRCCDQFKSVPDGLKRRLHSLVRLDISWCRNLSHIPEDFFCGLNQLKGLQIGGFSQELEAFPGMNSIQHLDGSLEELKIIGWKKLKSLPHQLQHLTLLGFPASHARTGDVLIVAQRRVKHTDTIFYVVRQNRLHPRESPYY